MIPKSQRSLPTSEILGAMLPPHNHQRYIKRSYRTREIALRLLYSDKHKSSLPTWNGVVSEIRSDNSKRYGVLRRFKGAPEMTDPDRANGSMLKAILRAS